MTFDQPILVATDLSARSDRAVDRALALAKSADVRLIVLHAIEAGSRMEKEPALADRVIRASLAEPGAAVSVVPAIGPAPSVIAEAARSGQCGLIVTGVARFNQLGDYLIGTAVDHVVRHADAPVLVVKQRPHGAYRRILVPTDFSACSRAALLGAARLFPDAAIDVVHAFHVPYSGFLKSDGVREEMEEEAREAMDRFLAEPPLDASIRTRITPHLVLGETQTVARTKAEELGADLVAVGTHGRSGFVPAVMGSLAEALLRSLPQDTLMVRAAG